MPCHAMLSSECANQNLITSSPVPSLPIAIFNEETNDNFPSYTIHK